MNLRRAPLLDRLVDVLGLVPGSQIPLPTWAVYIERELVDEDRKTYIRSWSYLSYTPFAHACLEAWYNEGTGFRTHAKKTYNKKLIALLAQRISMRVEEEEV